MSKSYLRLDEHLSVQRTEHLEFQIFKKIDKILNDECLRLGCDFERQQVIRELMIELSDVLFSESIFSTMMNYEDEITQKYNRDDYVRNILIEELQNDMNSYLMKSELKYHQYKNRHTTTKN